MGEAARWTDIFVEQLWRTAQYEDVYLKKYESVQDLLMGLTHHFVFYNDERRHQSLGYQTLDVVYQAAAGGSAKIVDKFGGALEASSTVPLRSTGMMHSTVKKITKLIHCNYRHGWASQNLAILTSLLEYPVHLATDFNVFRPVATCDNAQNDHNNDNGNLLCPNKRLRYLS